MILSSTDVRNKLPEALNRVIYSGERVEITRHGKVVGIIISKKEADLLDALEDERDAKEARKVEARAKARGETPVQYQSGKNIHSKPQKFKDGRDALLKFIGGSSHGALAQNIDEELYGK